MKKVFKILSLVVGIIMVVVVLVLVYLNVTYPRSDPPENIKIRLDPSQLQRGRYLSTNVAGCNRLSFHSGLDQICCSA